MEYVTLRCGKSVYKIFETTNILIITVMGGVGRKTTQIKINKMTGPALQAKTANLNKAS